MHKKLFVIRENNKEDISILAVLSHRKKIAYVLHNDFI
jgi:hypothetical protein